MNILEVSVFGVKFSIYLNRRVFVVFSRICFLTFRFVIICTRYEDTRYTSKTTSGDTYLQGKAGTIYR